ncbi:uracil-xanthine permease family protein [Thermodesulforhabdus norvegica]|uniref:Xanthine/uracil permease n=1 Tax=Thermodesulforhabdus norvegica TaxID=39841 RepID=A0A1I4SP86_9BACT|nr:solute carrier family 23 protein [Thermodesulforhabdus norvegica]SFM66245.1 Xanthine/uracil permease [Thermodesulforhabdus norvegica]
MKEKTSTGKKEAGFLYGVDERPPWALLFFYGLQWFFMLFPALLTAVTLCDHAFSFSTDDRIRFVQLTFIISGAFTIVQSLWGHGYPVLEGPATAHLLTVLFLAPLGVSSVQGGMVFCGAVLSLWALILRTSQVRRFFTPNVVVVILMLIAFSLLPHLIADLTGQNGPSGRPGWVTFSASLLVVLGTALLSERMKGYFRSFAMLVGIVGGTFIFLILDLIPKGESDFAPFLLLPGLWTDVNMRFPPMALVSCLVSYAAVVVNTMGSLAGLASVLSERESSLNKRLRRCLFLNGLSGIVCGITGTVGLVSYGISPGMVAMQRVASRYVATTCGVIALVLGFLPRIAFLCSLVPPAVVAAVLCAALGSQVAAAFKMARENYRAVRDTTVIGISVVVGLLVALMPERIAMEAPGWIRLFLKNSLVSGILVALLLEHLVVKSGES